MKALGSLKEGARDDSGINSGFIVHRP
jgi:hypothetical protein